MREICRERRLLNLPPPVFSRRKAVEKIRQLPKQLMKPWAFFVNHNCRVTERNEFQAHQISSQQILLVREHFAHLAPSERSIATLDATGSRSNRFISLRHGRMLRL